MREDAHLRDKLSSASETHSFTITTITELYKVGQVGNVRNQLSNFKRSRCIECNCICSLLVYELWGIICIPIFNIQLTCIRLSRSFNGFFDLTYFVNVE